MLTKEDLIQVLERSEDWYMVVEVKDSKVLVQYSNNRMKTNCLGQCAVHALEESNELNQCHAFYELIPLIIEVSKTKTKKHISEYKFKCLHREDFKFVDLQIYPNNGHIVICARDLSPIIYNIRTATAQLNSKLDELINKKEIIVNANNC